VHDHVTVILYPVLANLLETNFVVLPPVSLGRLPPATTLETNFMSPVVTAAAFNHLMLKLNVTEEIG
jgi:hypothetical protein